MKKIDLHIHTTYSDGNLNLDEIFSLAVNKGIEELAITDHDTIINLKEYSYYEKKYKLKIIPGIEIPSNYKGIHLLGYGINNFDIIEETMYNLKKYNEKQNKLTIDVLAKMGIDIDFESVKINSTEDVVTYRDIVNYLVNNGYASNAFEVYNKYIGKGTVGYFPSRKLPIEKIINLISISGGITILAHPFTLDRGTNLDYLISSLKELGLSGIESISPKLSLEEKNYYMSLTKKYNLVNTAGSDFHDYNIDNLGVEVEDNFLEKFNEKILLKR